MIDLILKVIGYSILWCMGMFLLPLLASLIYGFMSHFEDEDMASAIFWIAFILYIIVTNLLFN